MPVALNDLSEKQALAFFETITNPPDVLTQLRHRATLNPGSKHFLRLLTGPKNFPKTKFVLQPKSESQVHPNHPHMLQPAEALTPGNIYQNFPSQTTDAHAQTNLFFFKAGDIWSLGIFLYKICTQRKISQKFMKKFLSIQNTLPTSPSCFSGCYSLRQPCPKAWSVSVGARRESCGSLFVDMGRGWGRLGGLDLPSLNLVFYCKERDRGPVNERSIISLRGPLPGL
jgi:hypothetical protein